METGTYARRAQPQPRGSLERITYIHLPGMCVRVSGDECFIWPNVYGSRLQHVDEASVPPQLLEELNNVDY